MSSSITVSVRTLLIALAGALAVVVAYVLGGGGGEPVAAAPVVAGPGATTDELATGDVPGTITMSGEGEVIGVPDQMKFRVAVTRKAADVSTAMDDASSTLGRVLEALDEEGVARKDTQSTGLSVDPEYDYSGYGPPVLTGYRVNQSVSVLVRDLRTGGAAIAAAIEAGGNAVRVSGIGVEIGDRDALLDRAREQAVQAATAKAEQYAAATGQELGQVLTLTEGKAAVRPTRDQMKVLEQRAYSADTAALKDVWIRAGREDVAVNVSLVWSLLPGE
jgi:uncharacterized protein YggE